MDDLGEPQDIAYSLYLAREESKCFAGAGLATRWWLYRRVNDHAVFPKAVFQRMWEGRCHFSVVSLYVPYFSPLPDIFPSPHCVKLSVQVLALRTNYY
ncbi:MAG: hypothetical protein AB9Q22_11590 [Candidatus Reddybacter sp.]